MTNHGTWSTTAPVRPMWRRGARGGAGGGAGGGSAMSAMLAHWEYLVLIPVLSVLCIMYARTLFFAPMGAGGAAGQGSAERQLTSTGYAGPVRPVGVIPFDSKEQFEEMEKRVTSYLFASGGWGGFGDGQGESVYTSLLGEGGNADLGGLYDDYVNVEMANAQLEWQEGGTAKDSLGGVQEGGLDWNYGAGGGYGEGAGLGGAGQNRGKKGKKKRGGKRRRAAGGGGGAGAGQQQVLVDDDYDDSYDDDVSYGKDDLLPEQFQPQAGAKNEPALKQQPREPLDDWLGGPHQQQQQQQQQQRKAQQPQQRLDDWFGGPHGNAGGAGLGGEVASGDDDDDFMLTSKEVRTGHLEHHHQQGGPMDQGDPVAQAWSGRQQLPTLQDDYYEGGGSDARVQREGALFQNQARGFERGDEFRRDPLHAGEIGFGDLPDAPLKEIKPEGPYRCRAGFATFQSMFNYHYVWAFGEQQGWLATTAVQATPMFMRTFELQPVSHKHCNEDSVDVDSADHNWVTLRDVNSGKYVRALKEPEPLSATSGGAAAEAEGGAAAAAAGEDAAGAGLFGAPPVPRVPWLVSLGMSTPPSQDDKAYHFLLEEDGFVYSRGMQSYWNTMTDADHGVRGHSTAFDLSQPAGHDYTAQFSVHWMSDKAVLESKEAYRDMLRAEEERDQFMIQEIHSKMPNPDNEKRVISYGLYGNNPKYIDGAIKNAELAKIYYPGWIPRFYVSEDVPEPVLEKLAALGCEIRQQASTTGQIGGMFSRFLVADDNTVDRFIVRDADSRLNARERFAVEEWIRSGAMVHIIRDHPNHCMTISGGLWGARKGAIDDMQHRVVKWANKDMYGGDLDFLASEVWPEVRTEQMAHDAYCCDKFPLAQAFPTKRRGDFQHVGQVFDAHDNPRMHDIDAFVRGVPIPDECRRDPSWEYG